MPRNPLQNPGRKARSRLWSFLGPHNSRAMRECLHALHLEAASFAGLQVCFDLDESRRFQRPGQILFKAIQFCRMHSLFPYQCKLTILSTSLADLPPALGKKGPEALTSPERARA